MTKEEKEKFGEYSILLSKAIIEKLNEINFLEKHKEGEDISLFAHALSTMTPLLVLKHLSGKEFKNVLEFNHFANRLIMKFHKD